jgi:hypothetical protein
VAHGAAAPRARASGPSDIAPRFTGQIGADAWQRIELFFVGDPAEVAGQRSHNLCRAAIRADAKRILSLDVEQVRYLIERCRDIFVVYRHGGTLGER